MLPHTAELLAQSRALLERSSALCSASREVASRSTELIARASEAVARAKGLSDRITPARKIDRQYTTHGRQGGGSVTPYRSVGLTLFGRGPHCVEAVPAAVEWDASPLTQFVGHPLQAA